jgi:hypothetical protein
MALDSSQKTTYHRDHALDFTASVPRTKEHGTATARGRIILHHNRLYDLVDCPTRAEQRIRRLKKFQGV